ncbi:ommochrome-binding protein-like [Plodia interpunctella]|uniref:ommochrome-binding protein-like n=1 Tax=Plodia interpunctella TaxID=58824 RepID=UPI002368B7D4|nr:ommochrome-binding protein-like [Plodia interpunctella]
MKILFFVAVFALSQAEIITGKKCVGDGDKFEKETLVTGYDSPYQLAIDPATNTLFFSYSTEILGDGFKSVYLDLKTKTHEEIPVHGGGFAHAVDVRNNIVYIGSTESGISKFDYQTKKAVPLDLTKEGIWQMFFKDGLYFTTYPSESAYLYKDGVVKKVEELKNTRSLTLGVDNHFNIFFSNSSGFFIYKKDSGVTTHVADYVANAFTSDPNGNLYFSTPSGLYSVDENLIVKAILEESNIYGMVIEGEKTIIYASKDSVIRLKPRSECIQDDV